MTKRKIRFFSISLIVLLILCSSYIMLPSENFKTIIGIILIDITNKNVVMHPIYKNTFIVKAVDGSENGFDIFVEHMRKKGYILEERLGSIWIFYNNGEKLILVSSYKNSKFLDNRPVILFNP